jgi:hypothetical protein
MLRQSWVPTILPYFHVQEIICIHKETNETQ